MMKMKVLFTAASLMIMIILVGCGGSDSKELPFIYPNAIFHASSDIGSSKCLVAKNFSKDKKDRPEKFVGGMNFGQSDIKIYYEFVGTASCPSTDVKSHKDLADVYVIKIFHKSNEKIESFPIIYRGGRMVVLDRPDFKLEIQEWVGELP